MKISMGELDTEAAEDQVLAIILDQERGRVLSQAIARVTADWHEARTVAPKVKRP